MAMTFVASYPDRINGAIAGGTVSVLGTNTDDRYQSASFHFRNYHVYLNTEFDLLKPGALLDDLPQYMLTEHPFTNTNGILKGHKVHIFLTRVNHSYDISSFGRFVIESYIRSENVVTIHVPRNSTQLLDIICPVINTSLDVQKIHYAGEEMYKKLDYSRYRRIVNIKVERGSTTFRVNEPTNANDTPEYLIIGWCNYGRIAYMLKKVKPVEPFQLHKM